MRWTKAKVVNAIQSGDFNTVVEVLENFCGQLEEEGVSTDKIQGDVKKEIEAVLSGDNRMESLRSLAQHAGDLLVRWRSHDDIISQMNASRND